ncbi:methyl-accepting chemotaxis protein [Chrysiogenes arsenatis]|uniref:methyl-accepting chemotaxis protein n=1 Tax=Chrysiogenes arsenatis TaxID=309797 RepID=UPI00041B000A|nr:methyl-accepting chemotaxis protein [Chrysiogenes arsenatis]
MQLPFFPQMIKGRLLVFMCMAAVGTFILLAVSLSALNRNMHTIKNDAVMGMAQALHSVVQNYWQQAEAGEISVEQAKDHALRALRAVRYGDNDYIWVNDMQPRMVMHPTNPKLDGTDLGNFADPNGKKLFVDMVEVVRRDGQGLVNYFWPKPGFNRPVEKASYVIGFEPWGWVIGTGVYIDDINALLWAEVKRMALIVGVLLLLTGVPMVLILKTIISSTSTIATLARDLATGDGDLTKRIPLSGKDELAQVAGYVNQFIEKVQHIIVGVRQSTEGVASASEQLSSSSSQMSQTMNLQAESVSQIASASLQMSQTVSGLGENNQRVRTNAVQALNAARDGGGKVAQTAQEMEGIATQVVTTTEFTAQLVLNTKRVEEVIRVISDIADQTNLLALNAAIEAARAGDAGRGFAVVADEVRKLSERSAQSTAEIIDIVKTIQGGVTQVTEAMDVINNKVQQGVSLSRDTNNSFQVVLNSILALDQLIAQNANAMGEIHKASDQVSDDIQCISSATEQSAKVSEEVAFAANDLARLAAEVQRNLCAFIIDSRNQLASAYV